MEYAEIVEQSVVLNTLKHKYLLERGWETKDGIRWFFKKDWGTQSYKLIEASLNDAVYFQARYEGHIE